jgi:hypothetical protein
MGPALQTMQPFHPHTCRITSCLFCHLVWYTYITRHKCLQTCSISLCMLFYFTHMHAHTHTHTHTHTQLLFQRFLLPNYLCSWKWFDFQYIFISGLLAHDARLVQINTQEKDRLIGMDTLHYARMTRTQEHPEAEMRRNMGDHHAYFQPKKVLCVLFIVSKKVFLKWGNCLWHYSTCFVHHCAGIKASSHMASLFFTPMICNHSRNLEQKF